MKQLTYILLVIGVVQLLLTACAVEGKKHRSDKSHRSDRFEWGRAAKKGAAKKKGGEKLESEDICTKGDECQSGNCCPISSDSKKKACFKGDCNTAKYGSANTANPPIHEWETTAMWYKLFIKDTKSILDAARKCCEWKENGRLALVNSDAVYDNVLAELINGMKTKQNANKADTNLESTVRVDGTDTDNEKTYRYAYAENLQNNTLDNKYWYTVKGEPNHSPDINCAGIKHFSSAKARYKFATVYCQSTLPFLCEASKSVNKNAGGTKKKAPDAGKKKASDAGKKKASDAGRKKASDAGKKKAPDGGKKKKGK